MGSNGCKNKNVLNEQKSIAPYILADAYPLVSGDLIRDFCEMIISILFFNNILNVVLNC